ncbi:MAG TPA: hypothetical protein VMB19_08640 [Silvibacterium sp.]|nr:hypothetical protein [Silvibacterium sp.]
MRRITLLVVCTLALALCAGSAWAQSPPPADTLKVDYFSNANTAGAPDGTLRVSNPGTSPNGNLCASVFVFDIHQEMSECCSCLVTPDGLRTFSVNTDLTSNPLTGKTLNQGVIKVVSMNTVNGTCPLPTSFSSRTTPSIRAWTTHIQNSNFAITETASSDASLSWAEIARLGRQCTAIALDGSGSGICSCGTGD